ncbi:MAG: DUF1592 domain-containing protein [Akkermansiaceae bacterium]|nr:DUF1592 domain-containing protein [Akkermansiaceae bacterium]MDP4848039.1 DUF1592 domain-containing protein [Akkermansiaceae bacterium]
MNSHFSLVVIAGLSASLLVFSARVAAEGADVASRFEKEILPIMVDYCYDCHGDGLKEGELALDSFESISQMIADRDQWKKIRDHIDFRLMPPPDEFAPEEDERAKLVEWIDDAVFHVDPENPDPGKVALRRLNRTEYENTIRDLLGVGINAEEILPPDDSGDGFDNIGDALTISPVHMERYLEAARIALDKALDFSPARYPQQVLNGDQFKGPGEKKKAGLHLGVTGEDEAQIVFGGTGKYRIKLKAGSELCGDEFPKLEVKLDGKSLGVFEIPNPMNAQEEYSVEVEIKRGGNYRLVLGFLNNLKDPKAPEGMRDRNILVSEIILEGPVDKPPFKASKSHAALVPERGEGEADAAYFDRVMAGFLPRAFRRPVAREEVERFRHFLSLARDNGESFESALRQGLTTALVSPSFLFREEPTGEGGKGKSLISEHALASRLSYFLWSSMPDEKLLRLADEGRLRKELGSEVKRMMESPKASALVDNFAGQWLQLRDMGRISPTKNAYMDIDRELPGDMRTETEMLLRHVIQENLPIDTLMSADFTFLNERLADHYGIKGVKGDHFRKVSIEQTKRRGLLGHASILTLTSHHRETSPVLRGKFVLENLLNTPTPPAPPNVPALEGGNNRGNKLTMRQELERHRDDPACSSCHALMDPIGFGLDNYDIVGRWRDNDHGKPIDPTGTLVTGQEFASAEEMRDIFINDYKEVFRRAFAVKLLTYAMGRGVEYYDRPAIDEIMMKGEAGEGRFLSWVNATVQSVPFQYQRN